MAKFKVGDRVTVIAEIPEYVNRSGKVVGYGRGSDLRVQLDGDPYPELFGESELTLAKSLPTTEGKKAMAKFNVGDKVLVLPGNYRSGKVGTVVAFQDGDPAVQLEGLPEPELFAEWELRLEKSLPATKALEVFKIGDSVEAREGREGWYAGKVVNRATDSRGIVYAVELNGGGLIYAREGNIRGKSLPTTDTKALLRAKYKASKIPPDWKIWVERIGRSQRDAGKVLVRIFPDTSDPLQIESGTFRYLPDAVEAAIEANPKKGSMIGPDDLTYRWEGIYRDW